MTFKLHVDTAFIFSVNTVGGTLANFLQKNALLIKLNEHDSPSIYIVTLQT